MRSALLIASGILLLALAASRRSSWRSRGSIAGFPYFSVGRPGGTPIIAFHGFGGDPSEMAKQLESIDPSAIVIFPRGKVSGPKWWRRRAADEDQSQLAQQMAATADDFEPFLRHVNQTLGKPVLVGHSQGGMMATLLGSRYPDSVRSVVAAAAWLPEGVRSDRFAPTTLLHGTGDAIVPYDRSVRWANEYSIPLISVPSGHQLSGKYLMDFVHAINTSL